MPAAAREDQTHLLELVDHRLEHPRQARIDLGRALELVDHKAHRLAALMQLAQDSECSLDFLGPVGLRSRWHQRYPDAVGLHAQVGAESGQMVTQLVEASAESAHGA